MQPVNNPSTYRAYMQFLRKEAGLAHLLTGLYVIVDLKHFRFMESWPNNFKPHDKLTGLIFINYETIIRRTGHKRINFRSSDENH